MNHVRGLILVIWTYGLMGLMGLACLPVALVASRRTVIGIVRLYCRLVLGAARILCGLRWEARGEVPSGDVIVASKHQSFLDILILVRTLDQPRFVMKQSLVWAPVLGFYARRIGCVAVDRGARAKAVRAMVAETSADGHAGQLVIYPQGTRVPPGAAAPYKVGVAALQEALALPCVPAATNAGLFWPRKGVWRKPGTAVVEFLDPVPPGLPRAALMAKLERDVEAASIRLAETSAAGRS